ncbi:uncharacterized protein LOC135840386 [Planococcus citri]|uniref:uncharacterized protein LOC135840386 n=1 Tax=Planococcus citri TaxID=170843 RepID=UPI0031F84577
MIISVRLTWSKMFSFEVTFIAGLFIFDQCLSTIVRDDYSSATGTVESLNNEVINIHSNSIDQEGEWPSENFPEKKKKEWTMPSFPDESHQHRFLFADRNDMFTVDVQCDDAKTNLTLDLQDLDISTICFTKTFLPHASVAPLLHEDLIPKTYFPPHMCMETSIEYPDPMITFGAHRPLWGRYGEYEYLPKQRWMHNLEHGAVVMLYHPCAHPLVVDQLRKLVTSCLRRHIITPYAHLPVERPLALYAWGKYLSMSVVDYDTVTKFIKQNALQGPEDIATDGKYDHLLLKGAEHVSYPSDSVICPPLPTFPRD